jgi:hypothetical protein
MVASRQLDNVDYTLLPKPVIARMCNSIQFEYYLFDLAIQLEDMIGDCLSIIASD